MRKEIKEALSNFLETFQKETLPIAYAWAEKEKEVYTSISWQSVKNKDEDEMDGIYGNQSGLYIQGEGEYFIFLPKTTKAFANFYKMVKNAYKEEPSFLEDSIPDEVMLHFDGESTMMFRFVTYVDNVTDESEMSATKTLVEELVKEADGVVFYEGDDEPEDHVYHPGDKEPANYFVGLKSSYDIYEI